MATAATDPAPPSAQSEVTYAFDVAGSWQAGEAREYIVHLTNRGTSVWDTNGNNPVQLGIYFAQPRSTDLDAAVLEQHFPLGNDVVPGASIDVPVTVLAPPGPGTFTLVHRLVRENVGWFDALSEAAIKLSHPTRAATYYIALPPVWTAGSTAVVPITVTNVGTVAWNATGATPVQLAVIVGSKLERWGGAQRFALPLDVPPGGSATVRTILTRPPGEDPDAIYTRLVQETVAWFEMSAIGTLGNG